MDKKIAGLLGAVGALVSINAAQAATPSDSSEILKARSYSELLEPIPNAMAALKAVDESDRDAGQGVQLAQNWHHHHHHHHNSFRRGRRVIVIPRRHHHHHHHHHGFGIYVR